MIMCELAETERLMTTRLVGRGAWCGRPLMTPWEEAMYRTLRTSEETSWWRRSPSGPEIAPVYPRVEKSPSPVLQPRPVDNAEKPERGSSSRPLAVASSAPPDVEQCLSLSKQPGMEEALVPDATNVVAKPEQPALLSNEVTLESRVAVDHIMYRVVQLMQSGIQNSEQLKLADVDQEHEAENTHAVQLMDCEVQRSEQPMHAAVGQECRAEAKDSHAMQLMDCEIKRGEQLKRAAVGQEYEVDTDVRHAAQVTESKFWRSEQVKHGPVDQKHEAEVKIHDVQLMESEIHRSKEPTHEAFGQEHEAEEKDIHSLQLPKISEDPNPAEPTIKDHTDDERRQLSHQYALAGKDKSSPNDQKRQVFNEPVETPPPKRHKPREEWSCTHCQMSLSREEDLTQHQAGDMHELVLAAFQSRQEPSEFTTKSTPESSYRAPQFDRRLVRPVLTDNSEKTEPHKAKRASGFDMRNHSKHMSHQENTQTLHIEKGRNHIRDKSYQHALHREEGGKRAADHTGTEDQRKKFVTKRRLPFCELCKVQCNSEKMMESHLHGKKHVLNTEEGGKEGIKCAADRTGTEDWRRLVTKRRLPFCELCTVQCDSEKTLESHLGGKKHLEKLQAHHREMQLRTVAVCGEVPCFL